MVSALVCAGACVLSVVVTHVECVYLPVWVSVLSVVVTCV